MTPVTPAAPSARKSSSVPCSRWSALAACSAAASRAPPLWVRCSAWTFTPRPGPLRREQHAPALVHGVRALLAERVAERWPASRRRARRWSTPRRGSAARSPSGGAWRGRYVATTSGRSSSWPDRDRGVELAHLGVLRRGRSRSSPRRWWCRTRSCGAPAPRPRGGSAPRCPPRWRAPWRGCRRRAGRSPRRRRPRARSAYSSLRSPSQARCVWASTKPGITAAPCASMSTTSADSGGKRGVVHVARVGELAPLAMSTASRTTPGASPRAGSQVTSVPMLRTISVGRLLIARPTAPAARRPSRAR